MFVVILTYKKSLDIADQFLAEHLAFIDHCYANRQLIASGRSIPRTGGVLLAPGHDRAALETLLARDPFWREDIADFAIHEFAPSRCAPGFEALLD